MRMKKHAIALASVITVFGGVALADEMSFPEIITADIPGAPQLEQPFLVMAGDRPVMTGKHGLAAPALWDWDDDGRRDVLVGEFETNAGELFPMGEDGSAIRVYRNVGTDSEPAFTEEFEWARDTEGTVMEVEQWCCIGFTPYFHDLDDDGFQDMITGQYHPGEITWFRGSEDGFLPGVPLPQEGDPAAIGNPLDRTYMHEPGNIDTFDYWMYSSAAMGDFDDDGDYDLIVGGSGGLRISENIGGRQRPSFARRELLLDVNGLPLRVRELSEQEGQFGDRFAPDWNPAGDIKTNPYVVDWDNDGVLDLLVTDSYRNPSSNAITFFRGVKTPHGHRFEPGMVLLNTRDGSKALPGSGQRIYVADWNRDGIQDLIIGASVATVNGGQFSDELSWEWEDINRIESAGKDPGLYPPRPRPTRENQLELFESLGGWPGTDEEFEESLVLQQEYWDSEIGRLYEEGKEHWLTMRHQGRIYVMLGKKPEEPAILHDAGNVNDSSDFEAGAAPGIGAATDNPSPGRYPVTISLSAPSIVEAGTLGELEVQFEFLDGWYIYAPTGRNAPGGMVETRVRFDFPEVTLNAAGNIRLPTYRFKGSYDVFEGDSVVFSQPVVASPDSGAGEHVVACEVTYQTCKDDLCLPPRTETLEVVVTTR